MATTAAAQKIEKVCEIKPTKSTCKLECGAKSYSQSCDEPYNTCRSTCGLYDQEQKPAVAELLHALVQRTTSSEFPFDKRLELAASGLTIILQALQNEIAKGARPGLYVVILFAPRGEGFKLQFMTQLKDGAVPTEKDQLVVIFVFDKATFAALQLKEPSIEVMIKEARDLVTKRIQ
jgi:citrate lyase synthetase